MNESFAAHATAAEAAVAGQISRRRAQQSAADRGAGADPTGRTGPTTRIRPTNTGEES